ncbi:nuclear transport factor 2 family protein [Luteimonas sp. SX5]|uniref:Nuclear transport factor 2 family protein n=1 Tax=Luteimonas galliterrae TaxID=2940486 RepID=A0ABT0MH42_9GAMM|nr:nuclear transport factor 2 family protein [Luteimonas galliterrae]MCL1634199.1 nuclear transport factor 2 family protein [Luteimonas galliterrae]
MFIPISLAVAFATAPAAASASDVPADVVEPVRHYIQANARSDATGLAEAFHPAALMYWVDADGHVLSRTQADWRKRMAAPGDKPAFRQAIVAVDRSGDAAVVTVEGSLDGKPITDFMLVMKLGAQWRIVGKTFARAARPAHTDPGTVQALRDVVAAKLRSDISFRGDELLATQHPRSMFFNLDLGQLVAVSAQEWAARFEQRRREGSSLKPLKQEIGDVAAVGDVGYARWTVDWSSGNRITDYALFICENGRWRMINTAWVQHE